jgi:hypothetical protein
MSLIPLYPNEIDLAKISYAEVRVNPITQAKSVGIFYGSSRLTVQFPLMNIAYNGISQWENKDKAGNVLGYRYEMSLSFKDKEANSQLSALHKFLNELQAKFKEDAFENRLTWFKDTFDDEPKFVAKLFHPMIIQSKDKDTGRPDGKWPDTFKTKLPFDDQKDAFTFEAHDMDRNELDFKTVWDKMKGGRAKPILQLTGLWFAGGKFGATWRLLMSKFQMSVRGAYTYRDDGDDKGSRAVADDDEDDDMDIPQQLLAAAAAPAPAPAPAPAKKAAAAAAPAPAPAVIPTEIEDSDEEVEEEEEEEEEEEVEVERTPSPPPPPPPKKTVVKKTTKTAAK